MTANLATLDPRLLTYLELKQQQTILLDQVSSVRKNLKQLEPQIAPILSLYHNRNVPIIPTTQEMERFGDLGALKMLTTYKTDKLCAKSMQEATERFYHEVLPELGTELISALAIQHASFVMKTREKKECTKIERVYESKQNARKHKRAAGPSSERPAKVAKKTPTITAPQVAQNMWSTIGQHTPQFIQRLSQMG